ncbi:MAG: galactokinase [Clostridia bacterium]|nr:galactokinase [Clostridia bacterium]
MMLFEENREQIRNQWETLYGKHADAGKASQRWRDLAAWHVSLYHSREEELRFFSAPGRVEIIGNHTDHNNGKVVAAAITLDTIAAVKATGEPFVQLYSRGYKHPVNISIRDLEVHPEEKNTTAALVRGVLRGIRDAGKPLCGLQICVDSLVASGSGLSSSAAFEVLISYIAEAMGNGGFFTGIERAKKAQFAENRYFGKPCGLMDQAACSIGGLTKLDFRTADVVPQTLPIDFAQKGYQMCVVSTRSGHDDLTDQYAAIPAEMHAVAQALGVEVLRETTREQVLGNIPSLRKTAGDRAVLRALHFFDENDRVDALEKAVLADDFPGFLCQIRLSGESSQNCLQNVFVPGSREQALSVALEASKRFLGENGTCRVHGGGFAGTILAFVPDVLLKGYTEYMESLFGENACTVLDVRQTGVTEVYAG